MAGHAVFMLIVLLSNAHEHSMIIAEGFDYLHCLDARDYARSHPHYHDADGTYHVDAALCVREHINEV